MLYFALTIVAIGAMLWTVVLFKKRSQNRTERDPDVTHQKKEKKSDKKKEEEERKKEESPKETPREKNISKEYSSGFFSSTLFLALILFAIATTLFAMIAYRYPNIWAVMMDANKWPFILLAVGILLYATIWKKGDFWLTFWATFLFYIVVVLIFFFWNSERVKYMDFSNTGNHTVVLIPGYLYHIDFGRGTTYQRTSATGIFHCEKPQNSHFAEDINPFINQRNSNLDWNGVTKIVFSAVGDKPVTLSYKVWANTTSTATAPGPDLGGIKELLEVVPSNPSNHK